MSITAFNRARREAAERAALVATRKEAEEDDRPAISRMNKGELIDYADELGLMLPEGATKDEIYDLVREIVDGE